jgi:hypothetical protein
MERDYYFPLRENSQVTTTEVVLRRNGRRNTAVPDPTLSAQLERLAVLRSGSVRLIWENPAA